MVLDGLELLSQIHPAIGAAVLAFRLVVAIEAKRRENDKKVHILRLHMRDLMIAIFQLRHFKDPKDVGPDNLTINDRIGGLMRKIAQDIEKSGSVCEFYLKKSTISRVMKCMHHQGLFGEHIEILVKDRDDLDRALQIHIGVGVDSANAKLDGQEARLNSIDRKIENLTAMVENLFRQLETSRERDVQSLFVDKGGAQKCIDNDDSLRLLIKKSGKGYDDILGSQFELNKPESETLEKARKELRRELKEDVEKAFGRDMKYFGSKLGLQYRELKRQRQQLSDIGDAMRMGHDQILSAMKSGAHDRIIDYDFKKLWEGMAWNRSVKAKHLVIALHDYFIEKLRPFGRPDDPIPAEYKNDQWTLAYLNSPHIQPLLEAIDDDATGFITIREINAFVESKPKEWTLLQWIAYWAEGWKISVHQYKTDIYMLIAAMYKLWPDVLPANRHAALRYLRHDTIFQIDKLLQSTQDPPPNASKSTELLRLTQEFKDQEKKCLQENLEAIRYDIDEEYTVSLLTGPGRIERFIYPMLYLLLKHHYGVFKLATTAILDPREFPDMTDSLWILFALVNQRLDSLASIFKQSNVDVEEKLKTFAFGMLYYDSPKKDLSSNGIAQYIYRQSAFDGHVEPPIISPDDLVYGTLSLPSDASYSPDSSTFPDGASEEPIQGHWAGHIYNAHTSMLGLIQLNIKSSPGGTLTGSALTWQDIMTVSGSIRRNNQDVDGVAPASKDGDGETVTQQNGLGAMPSDATDRKSPANAANDDQYTVILRRTPASLWRFLQSGPLDYPAAAGSLARARWSFALKCVLDRIKRKNTPREYFAERFSEAGRFLVLARRELYTEQGYCPRLSDLSAGEEAEFVRLTCVICPEFSAPYCARVADAVDRQKYGGYTCDSCRGTIVGSRWACLTCMNDSFTDTVDLCSSCVKESVQLREFVHDASHVLLKCDTYVLGAHWQWIIPRARSMLVQTKKKLRSHSEDRAEPAESSASTIAGSLKCQACSEEVTLPCWVRVDSYCMCFFGHFVRT
ncbi:hypothetical protein IW261DRAFT_1327956 [Armillaria novae-zelandiae]|uniref:ZZ-type domain-containing protein n=1 Tax=Armillaria novae-zelandiae TaxID=153914 RepID=A0AA39PPY8_9AGAR|nr:hypothetical protein IW261DRAFT_1327956 [Armillaria novae-zelandiae]